MKGLYFYVCYRRISVTLGFVKARCNYLSVIGEFLFFGNIMPVNIAGSYISLRVLIDFNLPLSFHE